MDGRGGGRLDPGFTNFEQLKTHISMAYYTSQIGMKELGGDDNFTHGVYQGCGPRRGEPQVSLLTLQMIR